MLKIGHLIVSDTKALEGLGEELGVQPGLKSIYPVQAIGFSKLQAYQWKEPKPGFLTMSTEDMSVYLKGRQGSSLMAIGLTSVLEQTLSSDAMNSFFYARIRAGLEGAPVLNALVELLEANVVCSLDQESSERLFRTPHQGEFRLIQTAVKQVGRQVSTVPQEAILQTTYATYMLGAFCAPDEGYSLLDKVLRLQGVIIAVAFIARS